MAQEFYQQGLEKLQQGDRTGAISEFDRALQASPPPSLAVKVYYQRGLAHFDSGSLDAAIADYNLAIELDPEVDAKARLNLALALAHITAKAPEQAIVAAKSAVQLKPDNPNAWRILARADQQAQQLAEAIANYKQAAKIFLQQGNQAASAECVDAAYNLQVGLNQMTEQEIQASKIAQMQDLQSQLAQNNAFFTQVLARISAGQYQQVLADLNWLLRADARDAKAYAMRGVVYSKLGNYQQALQDLNQAAYLDGKDVQIKISRAIVRTELGDAIKVYKADLEKARIERRIPKNESRSLNLEGIISKIDVMSGEEFENLLAAIFRNKGYRVALTKKSGDYGADLILESGVERIIVQAKRYQGSVGIKAVQEVHSAIVMYEGTGGYVVTNSTFSRSAKKLAAKAGNISLWDRKKLVGIINHIL